MKDRVEQAGEAGLQILAAQGVQARCALLALVDHTGLAQHLEVVRAGGLGHRDVEAPEEHRVSRGRQRGHDLQPHGVAQGVQDRAELDVGPLRMRDSLGVCATSFVHMLTYDFHRTTTRPMTDGDDMTETAERNRWIALVVLCVGMLMIILDSTIVNVALPSIQSDLGFTQSSLAWVVNAYLIAFGGLLLLAGRVGDLIGRRRIFLIGLAVFTGASLLCGIAQSRRC